MAKIQDVVGMQYIRDSVGPEKVEYGQVNQQYATSTYGKVHDMNPSLIIQPNGDDDIKTVIAWARKQKVAIAVKSGGHQYSGASSTDKNNVQLDLGSTYQEMLLLNPNNPNTKTLVYVGVSVRLKDFLGWLSTNGLFVPTGQCAYVGIGGHGQSGGYGQLGRGFGLFGDHIRSIRMIGQDGNVIPDINKDNNPDLFYGILGGSPGNFGIITHYTVEVHRAKDYMGSPVPGPGGFYGPHALKGVWIYRPDILTKMLGFVAEMAQDPNYPRSYDLCVNVLSSSFPIHELFPNEPSNIFEKAWQAAKQFFSDEALALANNEVPGYIVVYAQWCPVSQDDKYDQTVDDWFNNFRELEGLDNGLGLLTSEFPSTGAQSPVSMADVVPNWIFPKKREFELPYVKRTYSTMSTDLSTSGWIETMVEQLDQIYNPERWVDESKKAPEDQSDGLKRYLSCKVASQIQHYGGKNSHFFTNQNNGTSYSWRDSTVVQTLDCFYDTSVDTGALDFATQWANKNDSLFNGAQGVFSKTDRRVLWGSWGDWDLGKEDVWKCYYEDLEKYQKIGAIRQSADSEGIFTPNVFSVKPYKA